MFSDVKRSMPPRFVIRTLLATLATVAFVLSAVLVVVTLMVRDHVLRKPGPLTPDEYDVIKTHPAVGSRILRSVRFLEPHLPIVELHHERPDGGGYPYGLRGHDIPVPARIVHVADAFDAITSARAYRPASTAAKGLSELQRCAGSDFDADVVHALAEVLSRDQLVVPADGAPSSGPPRAPALATKSSRRAEQAATPADPLDAFASEGQVA